MTPCRLDNKVMLFPSGKDGSMPVSELEYPRYAAIKYDGNYCIIINGELYTRKMKPILNIDLNRRFEKVRGWCQDKDIILMGELYDKTESFGKNQSIIKSHNSDVSNVNFYVFDYLTTKQWNYRDESVAFCTRYDEITQMFQKYPNNLEHCIQVQQLLCDSPQDLQRFFDESILDGWEGVVSRRIDGGYKYGRCSKSDMDLMRHTKITRIDGHITSVNQGKKMKDGIPRKKLLSGHKEQPHDKNSFEPDEICGSLTVLTETGIESNIGFGKGWTKQDRVDLWENRDNLVGRCVEIEYKPYSNKDKLRQGKLVRFRDDK